METLYRILKILIALLAAAVTVVGGWVLLGRSGGQAAPVQAETAAGETQASQAPDFTFYDAQGTAFSLSEFRGKPLVLNFWASWCGPCKSEMPDLEAAYRKYGDQIHFLMVDLTDGVQETVEKAAGYIAEQGYTFPVYFDSDMAGASAYGVTGIPVTYFIDAEGTFAAYYQGAMPAEVLQQGIDLLMEN